MTLKKPSFIEHIHEFYISFDAHYTGKSFKYQHDMKNNVLKQLYLSLLIVILPLIGCSTISNFNQQAYLQTTSLKVDALNLMDSATVDYSKCEYLVNDLQTKLQKAYEYEKNRPKNDITIQLWDKLLNKEGHLLGGFLVRWKEQGKFGSTYIVEKKEQVAKAFDIIAGLESQKIKASDINN